MTGIYILRSNSENFPDRETLNPGDIVIMKSGDIAVWVGSSWDLLPGRYLTLEQLKVFISYVGTGWPSRLEAVQDLSGQFSNLFLDRMLATADKLNPDSVASLDQSVS